MRGRSLLGCQGDAAQVEHRQHVAVAEVVLQREAEHVERHKRREGFQAIKWQAVFAEQLLHVGQRAKRPFAGPVIAAVHHVVEDLEPIMAHADRIGIGKSQAELAAHQTVILADGVPFAADVLRRCLHPRQQAIDDVIL